MNRQRVYVAHPVSGDVQGNIERTLLWYRALTLRYPDRLFGVPWLADVMAFDDSNPAERAAGLIRNRAYLDSFDAVVLVGGRVTRGMAAEVERASELRLLVTDLTHLGPLPPAYIP
jgi:hypothetical protein